MTTNLWKAKIQWELLLRPLIKTGVTSRFQGYLYKVVVQSVLLYESESSTITPQLLAVWQGFHHKIAGRISQLLPERIDDTTWYYPSIKDALEKAGLFTIEHYIRVRQNTDSVHCHQAHTTTMQRSRVLRSLIQVAIQTVSMVVPTTGNTRLWPGRQQQLPEQ
jgi:hypothetical protein